jgi:TonB-dependent receptor
MGIGQGKSRGLAAAAALSIPAVLPGLAHAQGVSRLPAVQAYDIERQSLAKAIVALAVRSGRNIVFAPALTAGKTSAAVHGQLSFAEALKRLLADSGLSAAIQRDGSVVISAALSAPTRPVERRFALAEPRPVAPPSAAVAGHEVQAVVVTGRTSPAVTARLDADTAVSVLGGPDLDGGAVHNAAEALGQVSGITVLNAGASATNSVPTDFAGRGEGDYISIRGLDAEFNIVSVNGVDVAQSQPYSRGVQLNLLSTAGLSEIVVVKSLTADMDGDAIGGLVDFRTPTAFDLPKPAYLAFSLNGQLEDEAARYGRTPFGGGFSAEAGERGGPGQAFGLYVAAYYDVENFSNGVIDGVYPAQYNQMFAYQAQAASGASAPGYDPARNLTLTGLDAGLTTGQIRRYGGDLALDWRPSSDLQAYLKLNLAVADTDQATYYAQIYGSDVASVPTGAGLYAPLIANVQPRYYYETNPETAALDTLQFGGSGRLGRLRLSPNLFVNWGETDDPDHFELSGRQPEVAPGMAYGGSALFQTVSGGAPVPLLNATQMATLADISSYGARRAGELTREFSNQVKSGGKLDAAYDLGGGSLVQAGFKYEAAYRTHTYRDYTSEQLYTTDANDPSLGSLGIFTGQARALVPGVLNLPAPTVDSGRALALFNANIANNFGSLNNAIDTCGLLYVNNYNCDTQHGLEEVSAAYLKGVYRLGDVEAILGFRFEHTEITNRFWVTPEAPSGAELPGAFASNHTTYNEPLPSLQLNYRPDPRETYRAALWASYTPPSMFELGGAPQVQKVGGVVTVTQGNPNLKAVQALNLDLSGDWASAGGGQTSAAFFYKALNHYVYDTVAGGLINLTTVSSGDMVLSEPRNGGAGVVYGIELSGRRPFTGLPAPLDRFGLGGNLTWERSSVNTGMAGLSTNERLINQPDIQGDVQLFYEWRGIAARLSYRYVGPYVAQYGTLGPSSALDTWVRGNERLDLLLSYQTAFGVKLSLSVANLLDDESYAATIGNKSWAIPSLIYSGRTYLLTTRFAY